MSLATYSDLQNAVINWLGRTDLAARVPEFITLAEADIRRVLRDKVVRESINIDGATVALPATNVELRSLRYDTDLLKYPLVLVTESTLAAYRRTGSGVPYYFAVVDNTLLFDITPDTTYTAEITYFQKLVPLASAGTTNDTLLNSPDIYLFGTLKEAEPYLQHDERNPMWSQKYEKAVADENAARERAELGAAPAVIRLPIIFG